MGEGVAAQRGLGLNLPTAWTRLRPWLATPRPKGPLNQSQSAGLGRGPGHGNVVRLGSSQQRWGPWLEMGDLPFCFDSAISHHARSDYSGSVLSSLRLNLKSLSSLLAVMDQTLFFSKCLCNFFFTVHTCRSLIDRRTLLLNLIKYIPSSYSLLFKKYIIIIF